MNKEIFIKYIFEGNIELAKQELIKNPNIIELDLYGEKITLKELRILVQVLQNSSITQIDLNNNYLCYTDIESENHAKIEEILETLSKLSVTKLSLFYNGIGEENKDQETNAIVNFIKNNRYLQELNLGRNNLSHEAFIAIFNELKNNKNIKIFRTPTISDYELSNMDRIINSIADIFEKNNILIELDLSSNYISSEQIKILFKGLRNNNYLSKISLFDNKLEINQEALEIIAETLENHKSLKEIDIEYTKIEDKDESKRLIECVNEMTKNNKIESKSFREKFKQNRASGIYQGGI